MSKQTPKRRSGQSARTGFALELYTARKGKRLTQEKVAEAAGISARWYQELERGKRDPGFKTGVRLMRVLEIPLERV